MARVTVEDCLEKISNRFDLVIVAAKRARQLALDKNAAHVEWGNDKPTVVALREIAEGLVDKSILDGKAATALRNLEATTSSKETEASEVAPVAESETAPVSDSDSEAA